MAPVRAGRAWPHAMLVMLLAVLAGAVAAWGAPLYAIDGVSMSPTLHNGDRLLVNRALTAHVDLSGLARLVAGEAAAAEFYPFGAPRRGDIVVFAPPDGSADLYVKRVIGEAGDRIGFAGGYVTVNGARLDEPYLARPDTYCRGTAYCETEVPAGMVYVLGDNRTQSVDSRLFGPVAVDAIVGEAWGAGGGTR